MVVGEGSPTRLLSPDTVHGIVEAAFPPAAVTGRRVLVIVPDGTRTMPMPLMADALERIVGPRSAALDYLVALGTHQPMTDAQRSYLETLCRETGEEFDETLSKADASKRIDELRERSPRLAQD